MDSKKPKEKTKEQIKLTSVCPKCHKPIKQLRKGSFTSWIFRESCCNCGKVPSTTPTQVDNAPTETPEIDGYKIEEEIGQGGMGVVYKVRDQNTDTVFAIKVLRQELASDLQAAKRFSKEAEAVTKLHHPNLVSVYSQGKTKDGLPYLLMDFAEGESLERILFKDAALDFDRSLKIFVQICDALSYAHKNGVIHRDIKPSNVLIAKSENGDEVVKLVDFGIAKIETSSVRETRELTHTADVIGSPLYMSPEQCLGWKVDNRSDIYSLGCLMFETLSGYPPFGGENSIQIIAKHLNDKPPNITGNGISEIPGTFNTILKGCLEKDNLERYQTIDELIEDLELVSRNKTPNRADFLAGWNKSWIFARLGASIVDAAILLTLLIISFLSLYLTLSTYKGADLVVLLSNLISSITPELAIGLLGILVIVWLDVCSSFVAPIAFVGCFLFFLNADTSFLNWKNSGYPMIDFLNNANIRIMIGFGFLTVFNWLYHALSESSKYQATIGKLMFNLSVNSIDGKKISFQNATGRHLSKMAWAVVYFETARLLYLAKNYKSTKLAFTEIMKQPLHDKIAHCFVTKRKKRKKE